MTIKIKKKKVFTIMAQTIWALFALATLSFIKIKIEEPYKELFQYCTKQEIEGRNVKICRVLLSNYYENNNNKKCIDVVLPEVESSKRNLTLCVNKKMVVKWDNPYDTYDLDIPVFIQLNYRKFPIIRINDINIELMSDEEAHRVVDPVNKETRRVLLFRSSEATKEIEDKGYYLTTRICSDLPSGRCANLGIYEAKLIDFYVEDEDLIFIVNMQILGEKKEETIRVNTFQFEEYSYSSVEKPLKIAIINIDSEFESLISKNDVYVMEFSINKREEVTDVLVEQYSEGNIDLEFTLNRMIHYVE